jgi:probable HAF family extracellular repeat protein
MDPRMRAATLVTIMFATVSASPRLGAQDGLPQPPGHYRVIDLGTLGGTVSTGNTINNLGWVMGSSNETGDAVQLATLWLPGRQVPLGTLGGPSSDVLWPVKNDFGLISGVTENGTHDPLNETFSCPVFGLTSGNSCVAFAWRNGAMTQLPGLGGNNSIGAGVNNRGQIVGWAENAVHDPSCTSGGGLVQVLQFEAVVWEMPQGQWKVRQLPAFPGDPDAAATAINDAGQVVGISGLCSVAIGGYSAIHAVLWEDGHPIDLHNLGGHGWNTPGAINNHGVVVGFANQSNDLSGGSLAFLPEAFVWTKEGGMQGLHTLPGDAISEATDINDAGQVVGVSYAGTDFSGARAFVYQNGAMTPLNQLISSSDQARFYVSSTGGINDLGEIAAQANLVSNGVVTAVLHAVLLVPTGDPNGEAVDTSGDVQVVVPESVQAQMRQLAGARHFGRSAPGAAGAR